MTQQSLPNNSQDAKTEIPTQPVSNIQLLKADIQADIHSEIWKIRENHLISDVHFDGIMRHLDMLLKAYSRACVAEVLESKMSIKKAEL